jgi:hypothetical protein
MSIDPTSCLSPAMSSVLWLFWFCNILLGAGFTLLSVRVRDQIQKSIQRKRVMEEATAMALRRQREEAALIQRKQEKEALDELMDEHIDCAECHPWIYLPLREPRLCREHSQLAQKKGNSQQHLIVCHSFTVEAEVL